MKVGFIGCGNMGGAIARALSRTGLCEIYLSDYSTEKARLLAEEIGASVSSNRDITRECKFVFLGVKPNTVREVLSDISDDLKKNDAVVVTMAAGVAIDSVKAVIGNDRKVIRIMPNTPVSVGYGMITWCESGCSESELNCFVSLMDKAGSLDKITEELIDAASALSGCGPAFVYMFAEALADGGVSCGLPRDKAMRYAAETIKGAALMMLRTGKHPGQLKDEVCSPGGSTIEGVRALEDGALRSTVQGAVIAAYEKTKKLGK
ncbi:MAG: pyrroline-5-carboxylate reductase [Clostridia bacterium]|nr:pyrroline-5-carboxylate reductase [Clostridia bacterium]